MGPQATLRIPFFCAKGSNQLQSLLYLFGFDVEKARCVRSRASKLRGWLSLSSKQESEEMLPKVVPSGQNLDPMDRRLRCLVTRLPSFRELRALEDSKPLAPSELKKGKLTEQRNLVFLACFKDRAAAILLFLNGVCMMVELELEGKLDDSQKRKL